MSPPPLQKSISFAPAQGRRNEFQPPFILELKTSNRNTFAEMQICIDVSFGKICDHQKLPGSI